MLAWRLVRVRLCLALLFAVCCSCTAPAPAPAVNPAAGADKQAPTVISAESALATGCSVRELSPESASVCRLHIEGQWRNGSDGLPKGSIKTASMQCEGPEAVSIAVDEAMLGKHKDNFTGVTWNEKCIRSGCLMAICGGTRAVVVDSSIQAVSPVVTRIKMVFPMWWKPKGQEAVEYRWLRMPSIWVALCIVESATVVLHHSNLTRNNVSAVMVTDHAHLVLHSSSVGWNRGVCFPAGAFSMGAAKLVVSNSTVGDNVRSPMTYRRLLDDDPIWNRPGDIVMDCSELPSSVGLLANTSALLRSGGGLGVAGSSCAEVTAGSNVSNNNNDAGRGGGVAVIDSGLLIVRNKSRFTNNTAFEYSACASVEDAASMVVGSGTILDMSDWFSSIGIYVMTNGTVHIVGPVVVRGTARRYQDYELTVIDVSSGLLNITGDVKFEQDPGKVQYILRLGREASLWLGPGSWYDGTNLTKCSPSVFLGSSVCGVGEYKVMGATRMSTEREPMCICCPPYTYGVKANTSCEQCPPYGVCPGADVLLPAPGFWHSHPYSAQMHKCPLFTTSCGVNGTCNDGYTDNLCGACVDGYGLTQPLKCSRCLRPRDQLLVAVVLFLACVALVAYTVHATWQDNKAGDTALRPSDLIKVMVQFLQYLVIVGSISVPWPSFLTACFTAASVVFASGHFSLDCFLKQYTRHIPLGLAYQRQLIYLVLSFAAVIAAVVLVFTVSSGVVWLWYALARVARASQRGQAPAPAPAPAPQQLWDKLRVVVLVVAFYAYPTMVKAALSFFACLRIDDANKQPYPEFAVLNHKSGYWVADIQQECFTGAHRQWALWLGVPASIVLCLGVPVAMFLLLWANAECLKEPTFQKHYGFLYRNFTNSKAWWEAVWTAQTVLLTMVAVFHFSMKAYYALLLMATVLLISAALQLVFQPYIHTRMHWMHLASTSCLYLTIWLSMLMFSFEFDATTIASVHTAAGVVIVVLNIASFVCCVYMILQLAHPTLVVMVLDTYAWFKRRFLFGLLLDRKGAVQRPAPAALPTSATAGTSSAEAPLQVELTFRRHSNLL